MHASRQDSGNRATTWLWIVATSIAITALIYGRSLALPFYSDDLVQIPWLRTLRFADLWREVSPYAYYRPLAFSLWLLLRDLGLPWTPAGLRLLNLFFHIAASSLIGGLALELDPHRRAVAATGAASLFAAFPFAYQAVPWVSAIFYPLSIALMILTALAYFLARRSGSPAWMVLSLLAAMAAPFAHENGMLTGLLVLLAEGVIWWRARPARFSLWPLAHLAIGGAFLALWFSLRSGGVSTFDLSPAGLFQNATILMTGASFPLVWLARFVGSGPMQIVMIWVITLACAALLFWLTRRSPEVTLFCAGWFLILSGPVLITMRPDWLIDAPRFLVPAGVGAALWWAIALTEFPVQWQKSFLLAAPLLLAAILPGVLFASQGVSWHLRGGAAITDAVHAAESDPDTPFLLVNLPDRIAPPKSIYPFFDGSAILLPPQVPAEAIIGAHTGSPHRDQPATIGAILPPVDYPRTPYGPLLEPAAVRDAILSGTRVMIADYAADPDIHLREAGQALRDYQLPGQAIAYFDSSLILWEAKLSRTEDILTVTLVWELASNPPGAPTVFVHVTDAGGAVIAQADGDPLGGLFSIYGAEYVFLRDVRTIHLPAGGPVAVSVGVWDPSTGERLLATRGIFTNDEVPIGSVP